MAADVATVVRARHDSVDAQKTQIKSSGVQDVLYSIYTAFHSIYTTLYNK